MNQVHNILIWFEKEKNAKHFFIKKLFYAHENLVNHTQQLNEKLYSVQSRKHVDWVFLAYWYIA